MHASHDQKAKRILEQLMDPFGRVYLEFVVAATDDQRFDIWFEPNPEPPDPCPRYLRMMRRMGRVACAMEPFSSTPGSRLVRQCARKQLNCQHGRELTAERDERATPPLFPLWILSPGRPVSEFTRRRVRRAEGWPRGVYWTDDASQLWFVLA